MRNAQQLRLEEPERRSLLSPHRAPQRQLLSRGTAQGQRRVSAPVLGGWEGDAVNGAKLPPGTEAGAPRRGGAWSAVGPAPCSCPGVRTRSPRPKSPSSGSQGPGVGQAAPGTAREAHHPGAAPPGPTPGLRGPHGPVCFSPASQGDEEAARAPLEPVGLCCPRPQAWGPHNCMATRSGQQASCPKTIKATLARLLAARSALPLRARNLTPQPCHPPIQSPAPQPAPPTGTPTLGHVLCPQVWRLPGARTPWRAHSKHSINVSCCSSQ